MLVVVSSLVGSRLKNMGLVGTAVFYTTLPTIYTTIYDRKVKHKSIIPYSFVCYADDVRVCIVNACASTLTAVKAIVKI